MTEKEQVLRQIDDIYAILHNNVMGFISGVYMIVVGCGIIAIPLLEYICQRFVDPILIAYAPMYPGILIFMGRTVFYWAFFALLSTLFEPKNCNSLNNEIINRAFSVGKMLPIIGVIFAAALALVGYADIIAPIILLLVGVFFLFYSQFTVYVVRAAAGSLILAAIGGVLLVPYMISGLWAYLVMYEGIVFVLMGLGLHLAQKTRLD